MMASKNKDREVQSHAVGALSNLRAIAIQILIALAARIACFLDSMSVFVVFVEGKSRRNSPVVLRHARTSPAPAMRRETHALAA